MFWPSVYPSSARPERNADPELDAALRPQGSRLSALQPAPGNRHAAEKGKLACPRSDHFGSGDFFFTHSSNCALYSASTTFAQLSYQRRYLTLPSPKLMVAIEEAAKQPNN